eukprot:276369-Chlamydomonas_euryale.AAC.2
MYLYMDLKGAYSPLISVVHAATALPCQLRLPTPPPLISPPNTFTHPCLRKFSSPTFPYACACLAHGSPARCGLSSSCQRPLARRSSLARPLAQCSLCKRTYHAMDALFAHCLYPSMPC